METHHSRLITLHSNPTLGTRLITAGLGLSVAAAGAFFCWYLWQNYRIARETDRWAETPCEIIVSAIDDSDLTQHGAVKYTLEIRYRYTVDGEDYIGEKVNRNRPVASADPEKTGSVQERYPVGSKAVCFVDPANPEEAILKRDSKAALYSIWFPALFVVGGIGIAVAGFRRKGARRLQ